jgi:hypothetical protein
MRKRRHPDCGVETWAEHHDLRNQIGIAPSRKYGSATKPYFGANKGPSKYSF